MKEGGQPVHPGLRAAERQGYRDGERQAGHHLMRERHQPIDQGMKGWVERQHPVDAGERSDERVEDEADRGYFAAARRTAADDRLRGGRLLLMILLGLSGADYLTRVWYPPAG